MAPNTTISFLEVMASCGARNGALLGCAASGSDGGARRDAHLRHRSAALQSAPFGRLTPRSAPMLSFGSARIRSAPLGSARPRSAPPGSTFGSEYRSCWWDWGGLWDVQLRGPPIQRSSDPAGVCPKHSTSCAAFQMDTTK